jgi:membrane-associated phospholipid phosphatase
LTNVRRSHPITTIAARIATHWAEVAAVVGLLSLPIRGGFAQRGARAEVPSAVLETEASVRADTASPRAAPLFTRRDAAVGASFAVVTAALFPFDERIAGSLQRPELQNHSGLDRAATGFELVAIPGVFVASGAAYIVGRVGKHRSMADVGLHVGGATVVAAAAATGVKYLAGRSRPYVSQDTDSYDFGFGRGLTKGDAYGAFPSTHVAVAFAGAAALTSETAHWWPGATRIVAPLAYGSATLVGLARMYHDQHWASDVALGAGVGTLSGLVVVRRQHAHPGNWIDRTLLSVTVVPVRNGMAVAWRGGLLATRPPHVQPTEN